MILPSERTMQRFQNKHVGRESGFQKEMCVKAAQLFESQATPEQDRIVVLSWDATGYKKKVYFNKHTGKYHHPPLITLTSTQYI